MARLQIKNKNFIFNLPVQHVHSTAQTGRRLSGTYTAVTQHTLHTECFKNSFQTETHITLYTECSESFLQAETHITL